MKKTIRIRRLSPETIQTLRTKGGAHSTKKGKKGYNRKREKISHHKDHFEEKSVFLFEEFVV